MCGHKQKWLSHKFLYSVEAKNLVEECQISVREVTLALDELHTELTTFSYRMIALHLLYTEIIVLVTSCDTLSQKPVTNSIINNDNVLVNVWNI